MSNFVQKMSISVDRKADENQKHEFDINCLFYKNDKLYSGADDGKIKVWSNDLKLLGEIQAHISSVFNLTASNLNLYSCSNDGTVKIWNLDSLQEKGTLIEDPDTEFWKLGWANDYLFVGDNQGNIRVYNNDTYYGILSIAEPVKELILAETTLFTANMDITITEVKLEGKNIQYGYKKSIQGKLPIAYVENKLCFTDQQQRNIIVHERDEKDLTKKITEHSAHELIILALVAVNWNKINLFSGGWDKVVKRWILNGERLDEGGCCKVDVVVNCLVVGDKGVVYVGGNDGHLLRLKIED